MKEMYGVVERKYREQANGEKSGSLRYESAAASRPTFLQSRKSLCLARATVKCYDAAEGGQGGVLQQTRHHQQTSERARAWRRCGWPAGGKSWHD